MRRVGAIWGVVGIIALLTWAIVRLTPYAVAAISEGLSGWQWAVLVAWSLFMVITEGYDGFYRHLAPRIVERAQHIHRSGDMVEIILAPLYCFGYFRASRKRLLISYTAIVLIIGAIIIVQQVPQPWRGIIDAGVVIGLVCGVWAIIVTALRHRLYRKTL